MLTARKDPDLPWGSDSFWKDQMKFGFHWISEDCGVRDGKVVPYVSLESPSRIGKRYTLLNQWTVALNYIIVTFTWKINALDIQWLLRSLYWSVPGCLFFFFFRTLFHFCVHQNQTRVLVFECPPRCWGTWRDPRKCDHPAEERCYSWAFMSKQGKEKKLLGREE